MGFHVRNRNDADVDDEVDVDGDDEAVFGDAQFTEGDILPLNTDSRHIEDGRELGVDPEGDGGDDVPTGNESLRDLVANGKLPKRSETLEATRQCSVNRDATDLAVAAARRSGNTFSLVNALESKIRLLVIRKSTSQESLAD